MSLKEKFFKKIGPMREEIKEIIKNHGNHKISDVTIAQAYGGMRDVKCMVTETSLLDSELGIRFRGYDIPQLREALPKAKGGEEPLPEGLFYLLLTGDLPTANDVQEIVQEWQKRGKVPEYVWKLMDAVPKGTHPMTQLCQAIITLQNESVLSRRYREGISKNDFWDPMYEDTMNLLAKIPSIAAYIYRKTYKDGKRIEPKKDLDFGANYAHMMGVESEEYKELMRLFLVVHADHEGGNASAHATHLVGSTLSDVYYSLCAGMAALAGPLHGLANQEALRWIMNVREEIGCEVPTKEQLTEFLWNTLNCGRVIPGFGHAVLRRTDPRYLALRDFALKHLPNDKIFKTVCNIFEVAPEVLKKHGKTKNPWPNVDAHSGCLQFYYGVTEYDYYTVQFGVSRAIGVLTSLCWDRALNLPLERPNSVTTQWIKSQISAK